MFNGYWAGRPAHTVTTTREIKVTRITKITT